MLRDPVLQDSRSSQVTQLGMLVGKILKGKTEYERTTNVSAEVPVVQFWTPL